jgi:hypothetical protein
MKLCRSNADRFGKCRKTGFVLPPRIGAVRAVLHELKAYGDFK